MPSRGAPGRERAQAALRARLIEAGHLVPSGTAGLYGRGGVFETVIEHFERRVTEIGSDLNAEVVRFPPVLGRDAYLATDHLETMPHLLGSVHCFEGGDAEHVDLMARAQAGGDWTQGFSPSEVVLVPAACFPLYPTARGELPEGGRIVDLRTSVYRHEPSDDPARMQIFRQREFVRLGTPEQALAHRDDWIERALELHLGLGLDVRKQLANDPFFGRGARVMRAMQHEQNLKYEIVCPITSREEPTAITSSNYHLDHFGAAFGIRTADGGVAHTACVGFGLERVAIALFNTHGMDPDDWPRDVRTALKL